MVKQADNQNKASVFGPPDTSEPNLFMASLALDAIERQRKQVRAIIFALLQTAPKNDGTFTSLIEAAFDLQGNDAPLVGLRKALRMPADEVSQ